MALEVNYKANAADQIIDFTKDFRRLLWVGDIARQNHSAATICFA